jgi:pimeloyl-ACP methyl ester carboxylesterase
MQQTLQYKNSAIAYHRLGNGEKILFFFHGYAEDGSSFLSLEKMLVDYTIICLDLPFHGATQWREGNTFYPADLLAIMKMIVPVDEIQITLSGYSLGARVAMHMLQLLPSQTERIVLLAPDGMHQNFWYWLSTQTWLGNKLFKPTMRYPQWFFALIKTFNATHLIQQSVYKLALQYMDDKEKRMLLYKRWTALRKFHPDLRLIKVMAEKHNIKARIVFGSFDRLISHKKNALTNADEAADVKVIQLPTGHQIIREKFVPVIAKLFYD